MSSTEHLVEMANAIGHFFQAEGDRAVAIEGIANHMNKFWEKRMRTQIVALEKNGGTGLDELVREAIRTITV